MTTIAAYVPDLMDRSKVAAAVADVRFVDRPDELASVEADIVVLDLSRPGVVDVLRRVAGLRRVTPPAHAARPPAEALTTERRPRQASGRPQSGV